MNIINLFRMCTPIQIFRDIFHRPGSKQRNRRHDILKAFWLHLADQIFHSFTLQLKHSHGIHSTNERIGFRIIQRYVHNIQLLIGGRIDMLNDFVNDGQIAQTEKIHLNQSKLLQIFHSELCCTYPFIHIDERTYLFNILIGKNNTGRMQRCMPRQALQLSGNGIQPSHRFPIVYNLLKARFIVVSKIKGCL